MEMLLLLLFLPVSLPGVHETTKSESSSSGLYSLSRSFPSLYYLVIVHSRRGCNHLPISFPGVHETTLKRRVSSFFRPVVLWPQCLSRGVFLLSDGWLLFIHGEAVVPTFLPISFPGVVHDEPAKKRVKFFRPVVSCGVFLSVCCMRVVVHSRSSGCSHLLSKHAPPPPPNTHTHLSLIHI